MKQFKQEHQQIYLRHKKQTLRNSWELLHSSNQYKTHNKRKIMKRHKSPSVLT